jgi:hypothetical protein
MEMGEWRFPLLYSSLRTLDMAKKKFDSVKMKREGAARVRAEIESMTISEQLAYWRRGTEELLALQQSLRKNNDAATPTAKRRPHRD